MMCLHLTAALDVMMSAPASSECHAALARHAVAELDIALVGQRWIELLLSVGAKFECLSWLDGFIIATSLSDDIEAGVFGSDEY